MPVTNNKKLLFFNKDGYPYNFELDTDGIYKGKLIFDENSSDTFKTLGIYCFEEVSPFTVTDYFNLNKMEIYNTSGISFQNGTYTGQTITNVTRVNASNTFYSKWIFGENFDQKFPKGSVVSFSGLTFRNPTTLVTASTSDFNYKYYSVLDNKPNAILVNTPTLNSSWSISFITGTSAIINSHNIICVNDYDSTLYTQVSGWTLHNDKKFSIIGSVSNDGIINHKSNSLQKSIYYNYKTIDLSGQTGDILKFNFELKTERPKLYQGPVTFNLSGNTAYVTFEKRVNSNINLGEGQSMIFEDYDDNPIISTNPIFTIVDGTIDVEVFNGKVDFLEELNVNKTYIKHFNNKQLSSQNFVRNMTPTNFVSRLSYFLQYYPKSWFVYDYYLQITGSTGNFFYNLEETDIIQMSSSTWSSSLKNIGTSLTISEIHKFKDIRIDYWKEKIMAWKPWYDDVIQKALTNNNSLDVQLELDAIWMYDTKDDNTSDVDYIPQTSRFEKIKVIESVIPENTLNTYSIQKLLKPNQINTVSCTMSSTVAYSTTFTKNVVAYDTSNILSFTQEILPLDSADLTIYRNNKLEDYRNGIRGEVVISSTYTIYELVVASSLLKIKVSGNTNNFTVGRQLTISGYINTEIAYNGTYTISAVNNISTNLVYVELGSTGFIDNTTTSIATCNTTVIETPWYDWVVSKVSGTTEFMSNPNLVISNQIDAEALWLYNQNDVKKGISYTNTINAFNNRYGDYLYNNYGISVYYSTATTQLNIYSKYVLDYSGGNIPTYDKYFIPSIYLNNNNISGITTPLNTSVNKVVLETYNTLTNEIINPNEINKFDKNHSYEVYFDLNNNSLNYGFNLELNDHDYYIGFSGDTITTINAFISKYYDVFNKMCLNLYTGSTLISTYGTSGYIYNETGYTSYNNIINTTGTTLIIQGKYSNVDVRTVKPKVNIYSTYKVIQHIENQSLFINGNELELPNSVSSHTLYDYGFSTGMVVNVHGSNYEQNNVSYNVIGMTDKILELSYQGQFFEEPSLLHKSFTIRDFFSQYSNMCIIIPGKVSNFVNLTSVTISNSINYNGTHTITNIIQYNINFVEIFTMTTFISSPNDYNDLNPPTKGFASFEIPIRYIPLELNVERFLRKPRESYFKDVYYNWKFIPNSEEKFNNDMFFYDVTGDHLKPYLDDPKMTYTGNKPLWDTTNVCSDINKGIHLIDSPNTDLDSISDPTKQQTMFKGTDGEYCLNFKLDQYDSTTEYNFVPEPLQVFLGFNSKNEGVSNTTILMDKVENIIFSGYTKSVVTPNGIDFNFTSIGELIITSTEVNFDLFNYGFEKNQLVTVNFIDQSITGTTTFQNYGTLSIEYVGGDRLKFVENVRNLMYFENLNFIPFTTTGKTAGYYYEIKVQPQTILQLDVYGETEIEDERFSVVLNNLGIQLNEDVEHIFIDSDIQEDGIDYMRLNEKRKEMLTLYPEIYNYIGSYKSLINAINFFGWNDLELYEYYKNIDPKSPLYQKLQKVLMQDMFDNTIKGWTPNDYISGKYKTGKYKKTNLFNLTYKITDEDGNNVLIYSLDEVQIKLNKLKRWLKRNILPLSTNIVDITGVADVTAQNYQNYDSSNVITKIYSECTNDTTVVNFVYTETLNFQDNYMFEIEFYTRLGISPSGWTCKIQTFSMSTDGTNKLIPQKYFKLMKNDLGNFSLNIDKNIDEYIYIETCAYNDYGVGQKYNKMTQTSTSKNYILINNRFHIPDYNYLNIGSQYYFFDKEGHIYLNN